MPAKSSLSTSTALSIFSSASNIVSSIMALWLPRPSFVGWFVCFWCCWGLAPWAGRGRRAYSGVGDERADLLTEQGPRDVSRAFHAEHDHGELVLHAEAEGRRVHHPQALHDRVVEGDRLELLGVGVGARVGVVDAVDAVLGDEHGVALDLEGALGADRVGGEERHTGAGTEDHDALLLEVADGAARDV